ncbi:dynamin-1-like, partial [Stegodyphus dumicola]|uniref:dynamin-1-like n=1 Tax=Stegodyphus dumicola TaxID=202533 RepID=UPI0015B01542
EFLPRGSGVVTRRPTVVQLQPHQGEEYAEFLHKEGKYYDFAEVKEEIEKETMRDPGPTGFSSKPISLKIYSPKVLKLTLVDLPGLIRNVVNGQPDSSIEEVRNMVLKFIKQPNSLILAVSPANQDIANSDALNIAYEVDPKRDRTIGVLTKLDLMDSGTDARDILDNKKIYLSRGYVGVLNRSQMDIDSGKDIQYALEKERHFFANTPCYSDIADRMGTPYLQKILNLQLRTHIKNSLPDVRKELSQKLNVFRRQLKEFENLTSSNLKGGHRTQFYMIKLIQMFIDDLHIKLFGYCELIDMKKIEYGALINYKLHTDLLRSLKLPPIPSDEELMILIANIHGVRNILSIPSIALEAACGILLTEYKEPLQNFVNSIAEILNMAIDESASHIERYPNLSNSLLCLVRASIDSAAEQTKDTLTMHLNAEKFFVNAYHWDLETSNSETTLNGKNVKIWNSEIVDEQSEDTLEEEKDLDAVREEMKESLMNNSSTEHNTTLLAERIKQYMLIEQKQIGDTAIKYILYFLVKRVSDFTKTELIPSLVDSDNENDFYADFERDFKIREEIEETCAQLEKALKAVQVF